MAGVLDPLQRDVRDVIREKMRRHAADIVEAPGHYQSRHLQCAQQGRHAEQRFPFGENLRQSVAQADLRRGTDQARHMVTRAAVALGIALEEFAAQHVANEFVNVAAVDEAAPAPCQPLRLPHVIGSGADICEDEAGDAMRRARGQAKCRAAAQREADDRGPLDAKRIEEARKIANQVRRRIALRIGWRIGQSVAALIVSDDAETLAQGADLMKPHALAAGEAMNKDHRLARAGIIERNPEIAHLDFTHWL